MSDLEQNTEVDDHDGIPCAHEQIEGKPTPNGDYYRVTGVVEMIGRPNRKNEYFVPVFRLDEFLEDHPSGDVVEEIVDVEPVSEPEKDAMLADYRRD